MSDETLFATALEQPDSAARAAYLDSTCPDLDTRKRIDALLAAHDRAGDFLARPAVERPVPETAPTRAYAPETDHTRTHGGTVETDTDDALGFLAPARRPDSLGRIGHYEVLEVLGRGGFGIVFRAFDEVLQRVVAVKALAPSMAATSPARKRFLREARSSAKVRHENVVQIHDTSRDDERLPYLVMEFIPGETLQERLDRTGPLEVSEVVRVGRQIAAGLAAAHEMDLIHRDIKPSNILIDSGPEARIKITDFGLARAADDASISQSGVVAGTPMYMAPEQAKGDELDHRADLFSLGSVLYVMCSGRPPFRASGTLAVLKRVVEEEPRPIREIIPEVPDWLCRIIQKLHAKDPADRFQSAKEVADVLADCEAQLKTSAELKDLSRIPAGKPDFTQISGKKLGLAFFLTAALLCIAFYTVYQQLDEYWPAYLIVLGTAIVGTGLVLTFRPSWIFRFLNVEHERAATHAALQNPAGKPAMPQSSGLPHVVIDVLLLACVLFGVSVMANLIGRMVAPEDFDEWNQGWGGTFVSVVFTFVLVAFVLLRSRRVLAAQVSGTLAPRIARWKLATLLAGLVLMFGSVWFGRAAMLYASNHGEMEVVADPADVDTIVIESSSEGRVTNRYFVKGGEKIKLPPGTYNLSASTRTAERLVTEWEMTSPEVFRSGTFRWSEPSVALTVSRGQRLIIKPVVEELSAVEKRNRDAIDPSKLDAIGKAAHEFHSEGFVPLFNGKDLTGWKTHPKEEGRTWAVQGGGLSMKGPALGHLFTVRDDFTDFHLRVEAKCTGNTPASVGLRASYKIEDWGGIRCVGTGIGSAAGMSFFGFRNTARTKSPPVAPDAWFTQEWVLMGNVLTVKLNGEEIATYTDVPEEFKKGHLVITSPPGEIQFRKIEIKELPSSKSDEQWSPLFNGKDLAGWSGKFPDAWSVENGILTGRGKRGSKDSWSELVHARDKLQDFHLRGEGRINAKGWASIRVRKQWDSLNGYKVWLSNDPDKTGARTGRLDVEGGADKLLIATPPDDLRVPVDEWFTVDLVARGPELVLSINGKEAARLNDPSFPRGEIQLEVAGADTIVQFKKIEIKELTSGPSSLPLSPLDREDLAKLKGEWDARLAEFDGKPMPIEDGNELGIRFGDGEFEFWIKEKKKNRDSQFGTFRIEAANKQVLLYHKDKIVPVRVGYRVDGDRLRLNFAGLLDTDGKPKGPPLRIHERHASTNNLKQLAIAMHAYADLHKALPQAAIASAKAKDGKPLLSWRVAILPWIEQDELYKKFNLDEPWDSEHNKKLIEKMPRVFAAPGIATPQPGMTHYRVFTGPGTVFEPRPGKEHGRPLTEILDGTASTLMIVEAADPVIWTRPDDLQFDPKKPLPKLGVYERATHVAMCDGNVLALSTTIAEEMIRALATRNGGESVSAPVLSPAPAQAPPLFLDLRRRGSDAPDPAVLTPLRDLVAATGRSRDQVKERIGAGTASKIDLLAAESTLVEARIRLAEAEGNRNDVIALHEVLVAHRQEERDLIAQRVDAGFDAPDILAKADARLADAKVLLAKVKPPTPAAPAPRPKP